jgi:hypothetical protein
MDQPITEREYKSSTTAKNNQPSCVGITISVTQARLGAEIQISTSVIAKIFYQGPKLTTAHSTTPVCEW